METNKNLKFYVAPSVEVIEVEVESGFSVSTPGTGGFAGEEEL